MLKTGTSKKTPLGVGHIAPDFELDDQDGNPVKLSSLKGKKVVLYFYPKDMTSGCTVEACEFAGAYSVLKKKAVLLGVSKDSAQDHKKFIAKHNLPFQLLVDDKKVAEKYDSYGEKSMYGRKYMGIFRKTFVIDENGRISKIFEKVKPEGHAKEVLDAVS